MTETDPSWVASKGSILIADDDALNARVLSRMVELLGYRAFCVENGAEVVRAIGVAEYDAVLMDCHMPVMDGYEATRIIRSREDGQRHVPIVAVTAGSFPNDKQMCLDAGMDDFIAKPVMQGVLATTLGRVLSTPDPADIELVEQEINCEPVNRARIDELKRTLGDEYLSVLATFFASTDERVNAIDVAINDGDDEEVRRLAHSVVGSARTFAADGIAEAAHLVQVALASDDRTLWADAAWRLRSEYNDLRQAFDEQFKTAGLPQP